MGVSGLLGLLKSIQKPCHLRSFKGQTIGVDAYCWLHRGAVACAIELAQGKPTTKHVDFAMHRVRMLQYFGITPYIVFDGGRLPSKAMTEQGRAERRRESKRLGLELLALGKHPQAYQELQKAVDITAEIAGQMIEELKRMGIQYVVAPYEADSQLAYLEKKGIINGIVSEDSDLLVFGAKTLITKLDQYGEGIMIKRDHFTACREVNLTGWSNTEFRYMAILSGCDYLDSAQRIGLKTAYRLVRKYKTIDRIMRGAQLDHKIRFPAEYLENFIQADNTFLYQWVYCPETQGLVHLTTPDSQTDLRDITYIGEYIEPDIATKVATGVLNASTKEKIIVPPRPQRNYKTTTPQRTIQALQTSKSDLGKPIDTFFKPKRTPLAELDPNVFTPSPSQQELLARQGSENSWLSEQAPNSEPAPLRPAPLQRGSTWSAGTTNGSRSFTSAANPVKRQRLCSDDLQGSQGVKAPLERSRFFSSNTADPSPLSRLPNSRNRRAKKTDFNIWSDDSVEDAMIELSQADETTSLLKSNKEQVDKVSAPEHQNSDSPSTANKVELNEVQKGEETPNVFSENLKAETKALRELSSVRKWSYTDFERPSRTTSASNDQESGKPSSPTKPRPTTEPALQKPQEAPSHDPFQSPSSPPTTNLTSKLNPLTAYLHRRTPQKPPHTSPARLLLPASPLKGSEDMLPFTRARSIPESDCPSEASEFGEYVASSSPLTSPGQDGARASDEGAPIRKLDFGRFAFVGTSSEEGLGGGAAGQRILSEILK